MSYLAIARKYRPATFDEIVGQEHVTRTLRNALERDRIHHAFLFCGARGVGKTTAARALARALNCEQGPTADPCGLCTSCTEIASGTSPDLIEIDGASNNSVDDVRDLREAVRYAPTAGRRKIYLVDEVHMLSKAAFNALLKTLEEPPPHVVFIFATTEPNRIPDTILSRVQRFDFKRIPSAGVVGRLAEIVKAEGVTISEVGLRMIARAGEGSMRDAQSLLDKVISFAGDQIDDAMVAETLGLIDRSLLYDMLEGLVTGAPDRCLATIEHVYGYGYELSQFTSEMLEVLRNATLLRLSGASRQYVDVSADELTRLDAVVADVPVETLTRLFNALLELHDQVSVASRPRIVLEMAVARLATIRPVQPVAELLARLEQLERGGRRGGGGGPPPRGMRSPRGAASQARPGPSAANTSRQASSAPRAAPRRGPRTGAGSRSEDPDPAARSEGPSAPARPKAPASGRQAAAQAQPQAAVAVAGSPAPAAKPPVSAAKAPASAAKAPASAAKVPEPAAKSPVSAAEAATPVAAPLSVAERWRAFCAALEDLGMPASAIAIGSPERLDQRLLVTVPVGARAARARIASRLPEVQQALAVHYPGLTLEVRDRPRVVTAEDAVRAEAMADPLLIRVVEALDADIDRVKPDPLPSTSDSPSIGAPQ